MSVIDRIAVFHRKLVEDPEYGRFITAETDDEAVEGSLDVDTMRAAAVLRHAAKEAGDVQIANLQLAIIGAEIEKLIGRPVDQAKREQEAKEARIARTGLSKPPLRRLS